MARLVDQGKVFSPKGWTPALIVKTGFVSMYVNIKEGPHAGREGWIARELVKPLKKK